MSWKETLKKWEEAPLTTELRNELNSLTDKEKEEHFYKDLAFGTGGIRGIMGVGTNRFNIFNLRKVTLGLALYLNKHNLKGGVAISYDNRRNSHYFAVEAAKVLAANNIKSYVYNELRPTPMLSFAVRHFKASAGIMITASHNPKVYNGYKVYNETGSQVNLKEADEIIENINGIKDMFTIDNIENHLINYIEEDFDNIYLEEVKQIQLYNAKNKAIVLYSPLHGTGGTVIPKLLDSLNYRLFSYLPHMNPDSEFTNTKSANPEDAIAFDGPIEYAKKVNADLIALTDPDADRLGIAIKHKDEYILLNGNQMCAILLHYKLENTKELPKNGVVYKTNVTSNLVEKIALSYNMEVVTTLTGFKFIGEQTKLNEGKKTYMFGCEESYGTLIKDFVRDKDAVQAVLMFTEIASYCKDHNITVIDYLDNIYEKYGYYQEITNSITIEGQAGVQKIKEIIDYFKNNNLELENKKLIRIENISEGVILDLVNNKEMKSTLPKENVIKFIYSDDSWVVLRPSGTEPKIKIYYATKKSSIEESKDDLNNMIAQTSKLINQI